MGNVCACCPCGSTDPYSVVQTDIPHEEYAMQSVNLATDTASIKVQPGSASQSPLSEKNPSSTFSYETSVLHGPSCERLDVDSNEATSEHQPSPLGIGRLSFKRSRGGNDYRASSYSADYRASKRKMVKSKSSPEKFKDQTMNRLQGELGKRNLSMDIPPEDAEDTAGETSPAISSPSTMATLSESYSVTDSGNATCHQCYCTFQTEEECLEHIQLNHLAKL